MRLLDLLVLELTRLPGVGKRSATRLALHFLEREDCDGFINLIREARNKIHACSRCQNLTEDEECSVCANPKRNARQLCIIERVQDLWALESSQTFSGKYFVLGGVLSPLKQIGPDRLPLDKLWNRIQQESIAELILALNSGVESEATELYIRGYLQKNFPHVRVTHLARGLPAGGELEYLDRETIARALEDRREA